jgi:hypothetical protein
MRRKIGLRPHGGSRQDPRSGQGVGPSQRFVFDEDGPVGAHREGLANALLASPRRHRQQCHRPIVSEFIGELQGYLDTVPIGVIEDLIVRSNYEIALRVQLIRRGRIGDLLDADDNLHTLGAPG